MGHTFTTQLDMNGFLRESQSGDGGINQGTVLRVICRTAGTRGTVPCVVVVCVVCCLVDGKLSKGT